MQRCTARFVSQPNLQQLWGKSRPFQSKHLDLLFRSHISPPTGSLRLWDLPRRFQFPGHFGSVFSKTHFELWNSRHNRIVTTPKATNPLKGYFTHRFRKHANAKVNGIHLSTQLATIVGKDESTRTKASKRPLCRSLLSPNQQHLVLWDLPGDRWTSPDHYWGMVMILPQVHLRKPCYDFTFL